jgi:peptidoglycan/LPS O-acetylase OafA/YrhL
MSSKRVNIIGLTSLRGIAALGIVFHHFIATIFPDLHGFFVPDRAISKLYLFVDLFFILSGFVLSHVYCQRFRTGLTPVVYKEFMLARFARIYPVHLFMLFVFLFFHLIYLIVLANANNPELIKELGFGHKRTFLSFLSNLFLLQGFPAAGSWNEPSWSISAEWFTYILVPFLVVFVSRANRPMQILVFVVGLIAIFAIEQIKGDLGMWWGGWPVMIRCLAEAAMGIVLYQFYLADMARFFDIRSVTILFLASGLSMALPIPHVITVMLFVLLVLATTQLKEESSHWLVHRGFIYLGMISYSIYMIHWLVRQLIVEPSIWFLGTKPGELLSIGGESAVVLVAVFLVIILSHFCYYFIEMPWRTRIGNNRSIRRILGLEKL